MYVSLKKTLAALRLVASIRKWIDDYESEHQSVIFSRLRNKLDGVDDSLVQTGVAIAGKRTFVVIRKACSMCGYYTSCITRQLQSVESQMLGSLGYSLTNARQAESEVMSDAITKVLTEEEARNLRKEVVNLRKKVEESWPKGIPLPSHSPLAA
jgi:hypothetical protein